METINTNSSSQKSSPQETGATEQNPISKKTGSEEKALISSENKTEEKSDLAVTTNQGLTFLYETLLSSLTELLNTLDISQNSQKKETGTAPEIIAETTRGLPPILIKPSNAPHPIEAIHTASKQYALKRTPSSDITR